MVLLTSITGSLMSMFKSTSCFRIAGGREPCPEDAPQTYIAIILVPGAIVACATLYKLYKK
ncbi:hypothetical protein SDRG_14333 [Saprolegnia diclina VS20]|nr:hypothetical protein SDRG_14333 [Saprolegnia diclina VS20]EQC27912.1 hypothetical protein SDRG_14333 [Saprolegnia diclina VS20]|eukprot:XP_008618677.1 hypothetical protein SDRG_14333 [Saprolegnia diclina VS20]